MISLFLLLGAFTFLVVMYKQSFSYLQRAEREARASLFAENTLSEVREWAADPVHFSDTNWAPWASVTRPEFPDFEARVRKRLLPQTTPSLALEAPWPAAQQARLSESLAQIELSVLWRGQVINQVVSSISEPERQVAPTPAVVVAVVGVLPSPLPKDGEVELQAQLLDTGGDEIADVNFLWAVEPGTGNASIVNLSRDGRRATLRNVYIARSGAVYYAGGICQVSALAKYRGLEYEGLSPDVTLAP
jgi:hypothetical protein